MSTSDRGFASMDSEQQHEIASKGGRASAESRSTTSNVDDNATYSDPVVERASEDEIYSAPAHNTRSKNPMPSEKPLSQTATKDDDIITYEGRQGFASMKESDPERQREIASKGGSGPRE